jgi:hypothetical protein
MKNIPKSILVLIGAILVSGSIFYFISPKEQIDGRFCLALFVLIFAQVCVWVVMADPLSLDARQKDRALPVRMGMGTVTSISILVAIAECWMYLAGSDYNPMVVTFGVMVFFFLIAMPSLLALTKKVAVDATQTEAQSDFMRTLRLRVGDLTAKAHSGTGIDAVIIKEIDILNDEIRYTTLQSFPGCEQLNSELDSLISTLESKFAATERSDVAKNIDLIKQLRSTLKRREQFITQLR